MEITSESIETFYLILKSVLSRSLHFLTSDINKAAVVPFCCFGRKRLVEIRKTLNSLRKLPYVNMQYCVPWFSVGWWGHFSISCLLYQRLRTTVSHIRQTSTH